MLRQSTNRDELISSVIRGSVIRRAQVEQVKPRSDPPLPHGRSQLSVELLVVGKQDEPFRSPLLVLAEDLLGCLALFRVRWGERGVSAATES